MDRQTLRDWVHRYNDEGLTGLLNRSAPGPAARLSAEQEAELARWIEEGPDPARDGVVRWRCKDLQARIERAFGSASTSARRQAASQAPLPAPLRAAAAPRERRRCPGGVQGGFCELVKAVLPPLAPGTPIEIWFADEARVGQQGTLTRVWAKRGSRPRAPRDRRYTSAWLFGAVCPERRLGAAVVMPEANTEAMQAHLAEISRGVARGAHAVLVLDGAAWHTTPKLQVPANISLLPLPRYAPELNPVELIWEFLRANFLSHRVWDSYEAIVDACCQAWTALMRMPEQIASITTRPWAQVKV
jgi:transposase